MRHRISGSIFWGLVFVTFGVLILARNLGYPIPLWTMFVRYWPVLLIVWGIFKLVDSIGMDAAEPRRPLFSGGDIVAIVLVILFGSLITVSSDMLPNLGKLVNEGNFDVWDLTGNNFDFSEQHVEVTGPNPAIQISGNFGDVEVTSSELNQITLDVRKTIRAKDQKEAERLSSGFVYSITKGATSDNVTNYRIAADSSRRFKASLTIHVPLKSVLTVDNRGGNVSVRGLSGNQEITNRNGEIEVHGITGKVKIQNHNGSVRVEDISDSVSINNSFGPVNVVNVRGELAISGRNNEIAIDHVEKDLNVDSAYQNVDIRDPRGAVSVKSRNGEISIRLLQKPTRDVSISSQYGNISVNLPSDSEFNTDVQSRYGEISSEFRELQQNSERADHTLKGQVGAGGPNIRIESRNGDIHFTKRG